MDPKEYYVDSYDGVGMILKNTSSNSKMVIKFYNIDDGETVKEALRRNLEINVIFDENDYSKFKMMINKLFDIRDFKLDVCKNEECGETIKIVLKEDFKCFDCVLKELNREDHKIEKV